MIKKLLLIIIFTMSMGSLANAKERLLPVVLHRLFDYKKHIDGDVRGTSTNAYTRFTLTTEKRNPTLLSVPSLRSIARSSKREFIGESYSRIIFKDIDEYDAFRQVVIGTVPHHRRMLPTLIAYFTPNLYNITLVQDQILSPFHRKNHQVYLYKTEEGADGMVKVSFIPKIKNTQLVTGFAIVEEKTGRIVTAEISGEFDMIRFKLCLQMGENGIESLLPKQCEASGKFAFAFNIINFHYNTVYGMKTFLPDSIRDSHDRALMATLRPDSLSKHEKRLYFEYDSVENAEAQKRNEHPELVEKKKKFNFVKDVLWEIIGDNMVNRIKGSFGGKDKGSFRINPILNPLYFGYSGRKGFVYKFDVRAGYNFTPNRELNMRFKSGYSFKLRQFNFRLPITFNYNKRRHAYLQTELGTGNQISNSSITDAIKEENKHLSQDTIPWAGMGLEEFKDTYFRMVNNYDISDQWTVQGGFMYHRRIAVEKAGFNQLHLPYKYHTFAPTLQFQYRPKGWNGPYLTLNWERSFRDVFQSDMEYEKYEFDASLIRKFHRMRSLSLRFGAGAYTMKNKKAYFLDYSNFRDENIRGGWHDDWSGNFQVLRSRYYNSSDFYIRANATFESPLMILSRLPALGKYVEMERIYTSTLITRNLTPYQEIGYGFTNRVFSLGLFLGTMNGKFNGIGCEFGLELFDRW